MKIVYGVPWIEVEAGWGSRPSGWCLYTSLEFARDEALCDSRNGPYVGGYIGPERPIMVTEIPYDCLDDELKAALEVKDKCSTHDYWTPKFTGEKHSL